MTSLRYPAPRELVDVLGTCQSRIVRMDAD
jgi:hypothetical protein